ncbi:TonB-dependent hemoglobin/transferrin/lactoferrin family receptor [Alteraurantiacibacter aquimixticola]|uniref:TonB-dependent hemoglobin/transferrin/lactoferrin family receptor n=1 Tax=Alteraurantiacibacter aquimixticola TaxID=2489173 RepID=A0A4T3EYM9_9SPHN|nr:TonB-dependent hemoglobin/transferrin/lactoferrin family receptor [Alteraurantiacibacter aquimixticola]TIX49736.1 TonB-dependent hemoglobin/transferrin/lactoferrin family receptor [Alteraurantiacibacter aquimixticola]
MSPLRAAPQQPHPCTRWLARRAPSQRIARPLCASLALAFALNAQAALADEAAEAEALTTESRITITATRVPVAEEVAPATVTVITDEDIADDFVTDIKDLVRYEPGVSVRRAPARFGAALGTTGRARNEEFTIRGIGGNRVLIQVDGIRAPQGFSFGAQDAGRGGYADVSLVKAVEILRGPASALYGSDGLAGAVSFITRDPVDLIDGGKSFGGFVTAQYSSADDEFAETAALAGKSGNVSAMVAFTRRDFEELENQGTVGGIGESRTLPNPQDGHSNAILGKLVWADNGHRLRLTGERLELDVDSQVLSGEGPAFLFGPSPSWIVDSLTAEDSTRRNRLSLDWTWEGDGTLEYAHLAAYWQDGKDVQFTREERSPVSATPRPDRERLNTFENEVWGLVAEGRKNFGGNGIEQVLAVGGDISWTRQEGLRDGIEPPFGETFPTRAFPATDFTLGGVYLADEIRLADGALTIYPALRFDFYKLDPTDDPLLPDFAGSAQSGERLSPKLGVTAQIVPDLLLFANYAQGFRAPTPAQVNNFFSNPAFGYTSTPNPDLGPERSTSYEAGIRYTNDNARLSLAVFRAEYDDFIDQADVGGSGVASDPTIFQFVNLDDVTVEGIEAKASLTLDNGFFTRFAAAYADGEVQAPDGTISPLGSIDPFELVAGIGWNSPTGRAGVELSLIYNARKSLEDSDGVCSAECFRPDSFTVFDISAFYAVTDALKLRAGVFNLFDETYAYWSDVRGLSATSTITDAYTRPGRNASVSLSYTF